MEKISFGGQIWPTGLNLNLGKLQFGWGFNEEKRSEIFVNISSSIIIVDCDLKGDLKNEVNSGELLGRVWVIVGGITSLFTFSTGIACKAIFETMAVDGAEETKIIVANKVVEGLCTAYSLNDNFLEMMEIVSKEPLILMALSDLNASISQPNYMFVACGRAVDAIRHAIAGVGVDAKTQGWPRVRSALNVDRAYLELITSESTRPRHGERFYSTSTLNPEIVIRRTWTIMNRLMEYRKGGSVDLTEPEYPLLKG